MLSQARQYSPQFITPTVPETPVHGSIPTRQPSSQSRDGFVPLLAGIVFISSAGNIGDISEYLPKQQANTSNKYGYYFQHKIVQNPVADLKTQLKFNNSDLARVIGVTRQAVHDWLNGSQISEANQTKLDALRRIAVSLQRHGIEVSARLFLREFETERRSLSSIIQSGESADGLEEEIIKVTSIEKRQREMLNNTLSSRNSSSEMRGLLTPHLSES